MAIPETDRYFPLDGDLVRYKSQSGSEKFYVAIYDYEARTDEDLTFRVGDLLLVSDDRYVASFRSSLPFLFRSIAFTRVFSNLVKRIGGMQSIVKVD